MSKIVLALLTRTENAAAILAGAHRLAVLVEEAQVEVMVVRILPISTIVITEEVLTKAQEKKIRQNEAERVAALKCIFERWASDHSELIAPRWIDQEGFVEEIVITLSKQVDYIVIGQPDARAGKGEHKALHAALVASGKMVLMMPRQAKGEFGENIAIAWRDDRFTLNALLSAQRLVPNPKQLHLLMRHRDGDLSPKAPDVLSEHNVPVMIHELPTSKEAFGAQLLAKTHEVRADLLVMGAFVHNSWYSKLFGSVTKHILAHADIPVLMRHS